MIIKTVKNTTYYLNIFFVSFTVVDLLLFDSIYVLNFCLHIASHVSTIFGVYEKCVFRVPFKKSTPSAECFKLQKWQRQSPTPTSSKMHVQKCKQFEILLSICDCWKCSDSRYTHTIGIFNTPYTQYTYENLLNSFLNTNTKI